MDKETLRQYRALLKEIDSLELEKKLVLDRYMAPAVMNDMPKQHNSTPDKIGGVVAARDKYQQLIDAKLNQLIKLRQNIEEAINLLPANDRCIIRAHYIDGKSWEQIAVNMHYSIHRIWHKHGEILAKMKDE